MKNILNEMKDTLQNINSEVDKAEDQIRNLEHKKAENTQSEQQKENRIQNNEGSQRSLWDIRIICVPVGEEGERGIGNLCEPWEVWLSCLKHCPRSQKVVGAIPG